MLTERCHQAVACSSSVSGCYGSMCFQFIILVKLINKSAFPITFLFATCLENTLRTSFNSSLWEISVKIPNNKPLTQLIKFEASTVVTTHVSMFWIMTLCILLNGYQHVSIFTVDAISQWQVYNRTEELKLLNNQSVLLGSRLWEWTLVVKCNRNYLRCMHSIVYHN